MDALTKINGKMQLVTSVAPYDGKQIETVKMPDQRANKPVGIYAQKQNSVLFLHDYMSPLIDGNDSSIITPNEVAMSCSIATKALEAAVVLRASLVEHLKENKNVLITENVSIAFDYIEEIYKSIVFSYRAVEVLCNTCIPNTYTYEKTNNRGILERYGKPQIERYIPTAEKVSEILPALLGVTTPVREAFWSDFKTLEMLRNEIVHSKSSVSKQIVERLLSEDVFKFIKSAFEVMKHFIASSPDHVVFPSGFGESRIRVITVDWFTDLLRKMDWDSQDVLGKNQTNN